MRAHKAARRANRHWTRKPPQKRQKVRPSDREQSSGTPAEKGRAFRGLHVKKQQKFCALCAQRTNDKQATGQRRPNTKEAGGKTRMPGAKAAGGVWAGKQRRRRRARLQQASRTAARAAAGNTRRDNDHTSRRNSGRPRKDGHPGRRRGTPNAEKPLRTGKMRIRSFACPEGPCEPGPPKNRFAVFGWHGLFCCALLISARFARVLRRAAQNKRGRRPLLSPAAF